MERTAVVFGRMVLVSTPTLAVVYSLVQVSIGVPYRFPGNWPSLALAFSPDRKASTSLSSGAGVEKDDEESMSSKAFGEAACLVSVDANPLAHMGAVRRGNCLRPSMLAMRAPSRTEAIVLLVELAQELSSHGVEDCRVELEISSPGRASAVRRRVACPHFRCGGAATKCTPTPPRTSLCEKGR